MTQTSTRRYRLLTRYQGEMAQVEDTGHIEFGIRGRSIAVTRLLPYAEAAAIRDRMEAEHQAKRVA